MQQVQELTKKIQNVIQHLITKENILIVTQDSRQKNERMLCVHIDYDMGKMTI